MTKSAELAYLFRALKAPAAARALPKLAERARAEEWSYERFAEALLATEQASRDAHGGEARIKQGDSYRLRDRDLGGRPPAREPETA